MTPRPWTDDDVASAVSALYAARTLGEIDAVWAEVEGQLPGLNQDRRNDLAVARGRSERRVSSDTLPESPSGRVAAEVARAGDQGLLFSDPPARLEFMRWDEAFDAWWTPYPKKAEKKKCKAKWKRLWEAGDLPPLRDLLDALELHCLSRQWQEHRFVPNPYTYLHGERWSDELEPHNPYGHEHDEHARQLLIDSDVSLASGGDERARLRLRAWDAWRTWRSAA